MYENIYVLNVHANKFSWVPHENILTQKFCQVGNYCTCIAAWLSLSCSTEIAKTPASTKQSSVVKPPLLAIATLHLEISHVHPHENHFQSPRHLASYYSYSCLAMCYQFTGQLWLSEPGLCNLHGSFHIGWPMIEYG